MNRLAAIWGAPVVIGVATTVGLIAALLLEGDVGKAAACFALAIPVLAVGWKLLRRS
jgi:hypothetical protein